MTMPKDTDKKFHDFFEDWFSVLRTIDEPTAVVSTPIPLKDDFFEGNSCKINYSFMKYLDKVKQQQSKVKEEAEAEGEDDNEADKSRSDEVAVPTLERSTSLEEKFGEFQYKTVFELFHDLKIACITRLLQVENDDTVYAQVDKVYKVATELLLRECLRLGQQFRDEAQKKDDEKRDREAAKKRRRRTADTAESKKNNKGSGFQMETSLEETLARDFELITATFIDKTGEALSVTAAGNLPLFTSLNNMKSELDDREPVVDSALGISVVKVIPTVSSSPAESFVSISPKAAYQKPVLMLSHILDTYIHPNWIRLSSSQWLKHGHDDLNFSFAPSYDEGRATISNEWKGMTWMQEVGFQRLREVKERYGKEVEGKSSVEEANGTSAVAEKPEKSTEVDHDSDGDVSMTFDDSSSAKIDLANLLKWNAGNHIESSETSAIRSNGVQRQISQLLLELNTLKRQRIAGHKEQFAQEQQQAGPNGYSNPNKVLEVSKAEVAKYQQLRRLLSGLIENKNITPARLGLRVSKKIPVTQHNYSGSLPSSYGGAGNYGRYAGSRPGRRRR